MDQKTFIVVGVAKSGTSMISGLLRLAGVPFGSAEELQEWNNNSENMYIIERLRNGDPTAIPEFNERYDVWGMKHPLLAGMLPFLNNSCRNPHFVFCFRDLAAVAQHKRKDDRVYDARFFAETMLYESKTTETMIRFAAAPRPAPLNILYVSYEKAVLKPQKLVDDLLLFGGLDVSTRRRSYMADFVEAGKGYKDFNEVAGRIDQIEGSARA